MTLSIASKQLLSPEGCSTAADGLLINPQWLLVEGNGRYYSHVFLDEIFPVTSGFRTFAFWLLSGLIKALKLNI